MGLGKPEMRKQGRIVGGTPILQSQFGPKSFMVHVLFVDNDGTLYTGCGGALMDEFHVLTAAHCFDFLPEDEQIGLRLYGIAAGDVNLAAAPNVEQIIVASDLVVHPSWNPSNFANDVAVILLQTAASVDTFILLPSDATDAEQELMEVGDPVVVAGWGTTSEGGDASDNLLMVELEIKSDSACSNLYTSDPDLFLCAGPSNTNEQKDSCQGDSGGPLFVEAPNNRNFVVGIVSFGNGCAREDFFGVYAEVATYDSFIRAQLTSTPSNAVTIVPSLLLLLFLSYIKFL